MTTPRRKRLRQASTIRTGQASVDRANDAVRDEVNDLLQRPVAKVAIKTTLEWGRNKIDHGVGEEPFGWHATTDEAGAVLSDAQGANDFPERQLWIDLDGVASCKAVIFIY